MTWVLLLGPLRHKNLFFFFLRFSSISASLLCSAPVLFCSSAFLFFCCFASLLFSFFAFQFLCFSAWLFFRFLCFLFFVSLLLLFCFSLPPCFSVSLFFCFLALCFSAFAFFKVSLCFCFISFLVCQFFCFFASLIYSCLLPSADSPHRKLTRRTGSVVSFIVVYFDVVPAMSWSWCSRVGWGGVGLGGIALGLVTFLALASGLCDGNVATLAPYVNVKNTIIDYVATIAHVVTTCTHASVMVGSLRVWLHLQMLFRSANIYFTKNS